MRSIRFLIGCTLLLVSHTNPFRSQVALAQDAKFWADRAYKAESENRVELALACFEKALEIDANDADVYFSRSGILAHDKKDYRKAIADLSQVLRLRPKNFSALFNRGLYKESTRDFDGAIEDYSAVLEADVDFSNYGPTVAEAKAHALHYRGRVYQWHKNDLKSAVSDFTTALKLDPSLKRIYYRRGLCFYGLKEYEAAKSDFDEALKHEPTYPNLINAVAWQLATCPDSKFRDGKKALELARKSRSRMHLAAAHAELGEFKEATAEIEDFISMLKRSKNDRKAELQKATDYAALFDAGKPIRE